MILQIFPNAGKIVNGAQSHALDFAGWPHPREAQELWRIDGAACEYHFSIRAGFGSRAIAEIADAHRALLFCNDARSLRCGCDCKISSRQRGLQVRIGSAMTAAIFLGHLIEARAVLRGAV